MKTDSHLEHYAGYHETIDVKNRISLLADHINTSPDQASTYIDEAVDAAWEYAAAMSRIGFTDERMLEGLGTNATQEEILKELLTTSRSHIAEHPEFYKPLIRSFIENKERVRDGNSHLTLFLGAYGSGNSTLEASLKSPAPGTNMFEDAPELFQVARSLEERRHTSIESSFHTFKDRVRKDFPEYDRILNEHPFGSTVLRPIAGGLSFGLSALSVLGYDFQQTETLGDPLTLEWAQDLFGSSHEFHAIALHNDTLENHLQNVPWIPESQVRINMENFTQCLPVLKESGMLSSLLELSQQRSPENEQVTYRTESFMHGEDHIISVAQHLHRIEAFLTHHLFSNVEPGPQLPQWAEDILHSITQEATVTPRQVTEISNRLPHSPEDMLPEHIALLFAVNNLTNGQETSPEWHHYFVDTVVDYVFAADQTLHHHDAALIYYLIIEDGKLSGLEPELLNAIANKCRAEDQQEFFQLSEAIQTFDRHGLANLATLPTTALADTHSHATEQAMDTASNERPLPG